MKNLRISPTERLTYPYEKHKKTYYVIYLPEREYRYLVRKRRYDVQGDHSAAKFFWKEEVFARMKPIISDSREIIALNADFSCPQWSGDTYK